MTSTEPPRLPRGRHGLPREQVAAEQRKRIQRGIVEVVAERGYPETRVVDVIDAAGVSRKTFYELFESKEDCFLAAYDVLLASLLSDTAAGYEATPTAPWTDRLGAAMEAFLQHLARHPEEARFAIVEVLAAGPRALSRHEAALRRFTGFLEPGRTETAEELPAITALSLAGGVLELLHGEILRGAASRLPERLPELMFWVALPYLGSERATVAQARVDRSV